MFINAVFIDFENSRITNLLKNISKLNNLYFFVCNNLPEFFAIKSVKHFVWTAEI